MLAGHQELVQPAQYTSYRASAFLNNSQILMKSSPESLLYEFGPFSFYVPERRLLHRGQTVALSPKASDALLLLVRNRGRVVEKAEFLRELWPDVTVAESNLTQTIYMLRRALEPGPGSDRYIENISKRGYRFVGRVREVAIRVREQLEGGLVTMPSDGRPVQSIAILPFRPLAALPEEFDYLGAGLAGSLIERLGGLWSLRVRPASAAGGPATDGLTAEEAGHKLQVQTVLEGGYALDGEGLRVTAQLVRVADGRQLWAGSFEEPFANIAGVEESIAERIAIALELGLTAKERTLLVRHPAVGADAYQEYMRGDYYRGLHTEEGFEKALSHFRRAVEIDQECAPAYTGLAACYELLRLYGAVPPKQVIGEIKSHLDRSLSLDDRSSEAYKILASVRMSYDWEWEEAERAIGRAVELNPNNAEALAVYNELLMSQGRFGESLVRIGQALEIDPLSPLLAVALGRLYYCERRFAEAVEIFGRLGEADRNFPGVLLTLGNIYESQGEYFRATSVLMKAAESNPVARPWAMAGLGRIYGLTRMKGEALKVVDELLRLSAEQYINPYIPAIVFESCGEEEQALRWLERAFEEHSPQLIQLKVDPRLDRLRPSTQFKGLLRRIRLDGPDM